MDSEFENLLGVPGLTLKKLYDEAIYPWDMLERLLAFLQTLPLGQIHGTIDPRADVRDTSSLYLGKGSEIGPGTLIEGVVYLGENVKIRHGAYIRGPAFIDDGSVIGHASEIKHSIFFKNAAAAHFNYVGNSILGKDVMLGAGATCANLRLDKRPIIVRGPTKRFVTEHSKMGALIGQGAKLGCQVVTSPGCVINSNTFVAPLLSVQGFYKGTK